MNIAYLMVGACWVTALVCGTYLIVNGSPWWGLTVILIGLLPEARHRRE